jgi:hypothetical protein
LAGSELIVFEIRGGGGDHLVDPTEEVNGIVCRCRNISYIWLEASADWNTILSMMRKAPIDETKFDDLRKIGYGSVVALLESLL